ncbi:MAG: class I tRNA ligase family protein, partial [Clostridia bacterium]|nr:class I tRNA ligase family protein [Clostridia bacterium]
WHIECAAMNRVAVGDQIDLHGGGRDLIFPHHENEIAQSESLTGKRFAKYWTHNGLIKVNGQKMSKSLGNSLLLSDLLDKYSPDALKFALLSSNYRGDLNITDTLFSEAEEHVARFYTLIQKTEEAFPNEAGRAAEIDKKFDEAMSDDFNTALALSDLFGYFKEVAKLIESGDSRARQITNQIKQTYSLLGLFKKPAKEYLEKYAKREEIPAAVKAVAEERWNARLAKDWAKSDELREKLKSLGYAVKDSKEGYELTKL